MRETDNKRERGARKSGKKRVTPFRVDPLPVVDLTTLASKAYHDKCLVYLPEAEQFKKYSRTTFDTMSMAPTRGRVVRMRQEWKAILSIPQRSLRERGLRRGRVDTGRLWKVSAGGSDVFSNRLQQPAVDACVALILDSSYSMSEGQRITVSTQLALLMGEALHRNRNPFICVSATTVRQKTYLHEHSQLCLFKDWGEDWDEKLCTLYFNNPWWGTNQGEALFWTIESIRKRPEKVKLVVLLSDGAPDEFWGVGASKALWNEAVKYAARNGVMVRGIGCDYEGIRDYIEDSVVVWSVDSLLDLAILKSISRDFQKGVKGAFVK